jgi:hypothetical protein
MRHQWLSLALLFAGCGGSDHGSDSARAVVRGTTVDERTREPIAGALVVGPEGAKARSDEHGRFVLEGLSAGASGEVRASSSDGLCGSVQLRPLAAGELEVVVHLR